MDPFSDWRIADSTINLSIDLNSSMRYYIEGKCLYLERDTEFCDFGSNIVIPLEARWHLISCIRIKNSVIFLDSIVYYDMNVTCLAEAVKDWKHKVFGNILTCKRIVVTQLKGIQAALKRKRSRKLEELEGDFRVELEKILDLDELIWQHKSGCEWLIEGDHNIKYVHIKTLAKRKQNKIYALKLEGDEWCFEDEVLKDKLSKLLPW
ncbi:hypothetical protein J1N35_015584 [Gossypium stocksii]|uniref:Uncharacterized protein n=1 Tax=Gossypium stocksii TaxID=47602 RepID=A0A9D3VX00_9ROSI|nr:hypothetical protein J1N35_015584 [Gossypium stocksii]